LYRTFATMRNVCFIAILLFLVSCGGNRPIDIEGHRGSRGEYPENSIQGFLHALEIQVTTLELDVHISADGQVVVCHDPVVPEFCSLRGLEGSDSLPRPKIYELTAEQLRNWDCGSTPVTRFPLQRKMDTYIPTLEEVIHSVEMTIVKKGLNPVNYNIEIKSTPDGDGVTHPSVDEFANLVLDVVYRKKVENRTIIQSFDTRALQVVRERKSDMHLALLVDESEDYQEKIKALGFKPHVISPFYKLVTEELVDYAHDKNMLVVPWTVNDVKEAERLVGLDVDGIITDYPDSMLFLRTL